MPENAQSSSSSTPEADRIRDAVLDMLNDRKGFDDWWDSLDPEIREELRTEMSETIHAELHP